MVQRPDMYLVRENLAESIAGGYKGYVTWLDGGNSLGAVANAYRDYLLTAEATVLISRVSNWEVNISIKGKGVTDFFFQNNFLLKDRFSEKLLIEGDWLAEWGVIGYVLNKKLVIDLNPFQYARKSNSQINREHLMNRYVINVENNPGNYKTVFNLEFEGIQ